MDFRVPFIPYADPITELPQSSECLMSALDFWPDTLGVIHKHSQIYFLDELDGVTCHQQGTQVISNKAEISHFKRLFIPHYVTPRCSARPSLSVNTENLESNILARRIG